MPGRESHKGRILCVTSNFPRWTGDSTTPFVKHLADDLSDLGWQIDILAPHASGALKKERSNKLEISRFQYFWPTSQQTVCYLGGALINLRKSVWNKVKLPFLVMAEFLAMGRLLMKHDYDLIHAHWILPQGFNAVLLGKLFRVPVVITVHGGDVFALNSNILQRLKRWSLESARGVTVNSEFTNSALQALSNSVTKLKKIPMGVDTGTLTEKQMKLADQIRHQYKKKDSPLLIFVGRLVEEKGVGDLIGAVAILKESFKPVSLLVVGEGQDKSQFEQQVKQLNLENEVLFTGWIEPEDIRSYLAAADIFVGPSKTSKDGWIEAQGLTFLEAMSVGTTVIATGSGGINETVIDGETGFLVQENNPEQIADVIRRAHVNSEHLDDIHKQAMQIVNTRFSHSVCAENFQALFTEILEKR